MPPLSRKAAQIEQSQIRAMSTACRKHRGINLAQGVCDTQTPDSIISAAQNAMNEGKNSYTSHLGIFPLRQAIAQKEHREKGISLDPEQEIAVTSGATGAMHAALHAVINPGDEVIVFEPYYGYHHATLTALNATIRHIRLKPPHWEIPWEELKKAVNAKTRALIINTPHNPAGKVFTREEISRIGMLTEKSDTVLISDEIYEYFVYDNTPHISPIELPQFRSRSLVVSGFSKTFSVTGWRVGYLLGPAHIVQAAAHISDLFYVCPPAPLQYGITAGLETLKPEFYESLRDEHKIKRQLLCDALHSAGLSPILPDGAYYILADLRRFSGKTSRERAMDFLHKSGVAGVPGSAFYHDHGGDHLCRFCFSREKRVIESACEKIRALP
ncbi:MAG: pyridoxal phosphate-dependent aminotransferase [Fibrobacterota bacterium]